MKVFKRLIIFGLLLVTSCARDIEDLTGSIKGTVTDFDNGQLISNCQITLSPGGTSKITGSDGQFEFDDLEPGDYTMSFKKSGYEDKAKYVSVISGKNSNVAVVLSAKSFDLTVNPLVLDFGAIESSILVSMTNPLGKTVKYTISTSNDWITVSKSSGSISETDSFTAIVSRAGLSLGDYDGNIIITANDKEISIPVKMSIVEKSKPSVSIEEVYSITSSGATVKATVKSTGSAKITKYGVCWSITSNPTVANQFSNHGDCTGAKSFESEITGLKAETKYYVRVYAENAEGVAYSEHALSFTTKSKPITPELSIVEASDIQTNSFSVSGDIISVGESAIIDYGHCWSISQNPTTSDSKTSFGSRSETGSFSSNITGLIDGTTYNVRAYAINSQGISYSDPITVTTSEVATDIWDGTKASSFAGGSGTTADPYQIESGGQLVRIKNFSDKCFILKKNINLDNRSWPAIEFSGTLDGNGYTISNLKITRTEDNLGFFSKLTGTVKNLHIRGVNIQSGTSNNIGAIAGTFCYDGKISNCSVTLRSDSKILGNNCVGGFVGYFGDEYKENNSDLIISKCNLTSASTENVILGNDYVGGISGFAIASYVGKYTNTIDGCHANAKIYGNSEVGGICGSCSKGKFYITNCSFKGAVSGKEEVAGILGGENYNYSITINIYGCKVEADILASVNYAGGIFGYIFLSDVIARGCYTSGTLNCDSYTAYLGGIGGNPGQYSSAKIELCYSAMQSSNSKFSDICVNSSTKDCTSIATCDNITEYLHSRYSEYAKYYNFNNTWTWVGTIDGDSKSISCPRLSWE